MRIGYYRKPQQRLNWGSQTTITEPVSTWKALLTKAALEKPWFRSSLAQVMAKIESVEGDASE